MRAMVKNDAAQLQRIVNILKNNYQFKPRDMDEFASQDPDVRSDVQRALESVFDMLNISYDNIDEDEMELEACVTNPYIVALKH